MEKLQQFQPSTLLSSLEDERTRQVMCELLSNLGDILSSTFPIEGLGNMNVEKMRVGLFFGVAESGGLRSFTPADSCATRSRSPSPDRRSCGVWSAVVCSSSATSWKLGSLCRGRTSLMKTMASGGQSGQWPPLESVAPKAEGSLRKRVRSRYRWAH